MERKRCLLFSVGAVLLLVLILVLRLKLQQEPSDFQLKFISRCEDFKEYDCQKLWTLFEQAYVGRDPCKVPMEAYDGFIAAVTLKPASNRTMFWSKTKDLVRRFTEKKDCFVTLKDTPLGHVADGLTWCGKEGSTETFTTDCPGWTDCDNNTVHSYWRRASTAFAQHAEGVVTAMLDGDVPEPYYPNSTFRNVEVPNLTSPRVTGLDVILVTKKGTCDNKSLGKLKDDLQGKRIAYSCKPVTRAHVESCAKDNSSCSDCLSRPHSGSGTSEFILRTNWFLFVVFTFFSSFVHII